MSWHHEGRGTYNTMKAVHHVICHDTMKAVEFTTPWRPYIMSYVMTPWRPWNLQHHEGRTSCHMSWHVVLTSYWFGGSAIGNVVIPDITHHVTTSLLARCTNIYRRTERQRERDRQRERERERQRFQAPHKTRGRQQRPIFTCLAVDHTHIHHMHHTMTTWGLLVIPGARWNVLLFLRQAAP